MAPSLSWEISRKEWIDHRLKIAAAITEYRLHLTTQTEAEAHALARDTARDSSTSGIATP